MKKSRFTLMILALVMILSVFALAGCRSNGIGNDDATTNNATENETTDDMKRDEDGTIKAELKVTALDDKDKELKAEPRTITIK